MDSQTSQNGPELSQNEMKGLFEVLHERHRNTWTLVDQTHVPGMSSNPILY
jgi:hypothetical protein